MLALDSRLRRSFLHAMQDGGRVIPERPDRQRAPQQEAAPASFGGHRDGPQVLSAQGPSASAEVIPTAECPVVAYRQGAADLCAAYGLASAVQHYGDAQAAWACVHGSNQRLPPWLTAAAWR